MFKRIKESIRDEEMLKEFCEHLRKININATLLKSEPKVQAFTNFIGSVNIENRNIDLVEVEMKQVGGGEFGGEFGCSTKMYRYNYVVQTKIDGLENNLKAEAKPIKKSFFSKEVVGQKWKGGSLAQLLNADSNLKTMLLREGLIALEIRPDKKN